MKAITREQFHLLTIGDVKIHARALDQVRGLQWSERANSARNAVMDAQDYAEMAKAMSACVDVLSDYPDLASGRDGAVLRETWDEITSEQVTEAIDALLEVNDPFVRVRRERAEQERKGWERVMMLPEAERSEILRPFLSRLASDSESTRGKSRTDGPGRSSSRPATQ